MKTRLCDRYYGLGPLSFFEGNPPAGGDAGGSGAPAPAPPAPQAPPQTAPTTPGAPPSGEREGFVPRDRFDQVNSELQKLRQAEEERARQELEKKGEHEKLAAQEKEKREAAELKALNIARRASFIAAASGKVADPEAAYKLAAADGLLNDLDVDDDGNAKDAKKPGAIVEEVVKRYEFLKAKTGTGRDYGQDRSGAGGAPEVPKDRDPLSLLSAGYAQSSGRQRGS